jgi:hypothetical protein
MKIIGIAYGCPIVFRGKCRKIKHTRPHLSVQSDV